MGASTYLSGVGVILAAGLRDLVAGVLEVSVVLQPLALLLDAAALHLSQENA